jgi:hypothetical protein
MSLGSVSRQYYDPSSNKILMAVNYPGSMAHITSMDLATGKITRIAPVPTPNLYSVTSLAYDDSTETIFTTTRNKDWRGLQSIAVKTGKVTDLVKFTRCGDLVFNPKSRALWGIQSSSGRSSLLRFVPPYQQFEVVMTMPYGQDLTDPAISPDGQLLAITLSDVTGSQKLAVFKIPDLLAGKTDYQVLYEFEDNNASGFVFSPDGSCLFGTSYYTGVSNVFRISLDTREAEILTNAETGFFRPLPISADSMIVFNYSQQGMIAGIMKINPLPDVNAIRFLGQQVYDKYPEVETWALDPPSVVNLDALQVVERPYQPVRELRLASAYPIIQGYKDFIAAGYRFNFMDPMGLNALSMKLSASPADSLPAKQIPHLSVEYNFWNWTFTGNYNYADFYDLFGPTKFSRAGYSFSTRYYKLINRFAPNKTDLYVKLSVYGDLETLPGNQNIASDYKNLFVGTFNFHKSYLRKSLGAIEPEQGYDWNVYAYSSFAKQTFYPQLINNFDVGFLLPLRNSSLWLRTSMGQSFGNPDKSNSYFYFGGFGNNYLDYRNAQLYREMSSFPGMEIDAISALNYGKLAMEWNVKPLRFKKLGFKGLYSTYSRLTFFGMGLFTNLANEQQQTNYYSAGLQIDFEIVLFTLLKSTLSFGYSKAGLKALHRDQFMVSLKL